MRRLISLICPTAARVLAANARLTTGAMREASVRGEQLGLTEDELAFYDALETNDNAVQVLGDETLRAIARELVETVRRNVTIDWTLRENVRAQRRVMVRRILNRYGYRPTSRSRRRSPSSSRRRSCRRAGRRWHDSAVLTAELQNLRCPDPNGAYPGASSYAA